MSERIISCVAIDDEPNALALINEYIQTVPYLKLESAFTNPVEALAFIQSTSVDLLFVDINMPLLSGLQLLKSLSNPPLCILTTAYSEFALEGFELNVVDYLLKPIEFDRFLKACNKALNSHKVPSNKERRRDKKSLIKFKSGQKVYQVGNEEILFLEASGNYLIVHTDKEKIMTLMNMEEAINFLPESGFIRVHRSYIVNVKRIKSVENYKIQIDQHLISISKSYRKVFMEKFMA
ncbi:MAG: LytTR family DNA-binding domain-containing protein [Ekhidna sp.]